MPALGIKITNVDKFYQQQISRESGSNSTRLQSAGTRVQFLDVPGRFGRTKKPKTLLSFSYASPTKLRQNFTIYRHRKDRKNGSIGLIVVLSTAAAVVQFSCI